MGLPIVTRLTDVRTRTEELRSTDTETVTDPDRFSSQVLQSSLSSSASSLTEIKNLTTLLMEVAKSCKKKQMDDVTSEKQLTKKFVIKHFPRGRGIGRVSVVARGSKEQLPESKIKEHTGFNRDIYH